MKTLINFLKILLLSFGCILLVAVALSFTEMPFWAHYNLSMTESTLTSEPEQLIMLSGGGMPSGDGLMKAYYAARLAEEFPSLEILIALPNDTTDSAGIKNLMQYKYALAGFGVDTSHVRWLKDGHNTRTQALAASGSKHKPTIVLTEPVHTYRAVCAFQKVGFKQVRGMATHEKSLGEKELTSHAPDIEEVKDLDLRYNMWNYLKYEISVAREYTAISYYWLRGWI